MIECYDDVQHDRENESGLNNDSYHICHPLSNEQWWEKNERLLNGFEELHQTIQGKKNDQTRDIDSTKTPF